MTTYPCCIHCHHPEDAPPPRKHREPCGGWDCPGSEPEGGDDE